MSTRSRGCHASSWLLSPLVVLIVLCRGSHQIAKNFVNSSTPDLRPTFVVNFDTSTVICQHSSDPTDLHLHNMSSLCDGKQDCFVNPAMHDEVFPYCEHKCESTCSGKGACLYDGSKPQCYCDSGFSGSACELQDKNECLEHPCHMMAQCQNTLGSYECRCLPGYEGNGHECTDIDECKQNSKCPEHSKCINLPGTYYCNCTQGFSPKGNQGSGLDKCVDINECETGAHNCESNEICENTIGSFKCVTKCSPGYKLVDGKCEDVNECQSKDLHKCDVRAECINTVGGYECECEEGFDGDGKNCQPKSSCRKNSAICDRHASCNVFLDICDCKTGYTGDGITCHDVNECDAKETPCPGEGRCLNLDGGYVCCKNGQDDETCIKDQGAFCSGGCGDNAICSNSTCACIEGFRGDPHKKCVDINECEENDSICGGVGDRCVNLFGGFKCCQHGSQDTECQDQAFSSDSSTISSGADFSTTGEQIIEGSGSIQTSSGGQITVTRGLVPKDVELTTSGRLSCTSYCPPNSECISGYCECVKGYGGNALIGCEDIDECATETCDVSANEWCVNLIGGFVCCNPTNATHDDCIGLEITKEKGLHVIGPNEEDTVIATKSNHSTSDELITSVIQQSKNFSSGQILFTRKHVLEGEEITQGPGSGEFGLEISGKDLAGITLPSTVTPEGSGKAGKSSGLWTEEEDGEDDDLMEGEGSGSWTTVINGTGITGSPRSEGTIRVRITTLGEDGETETATKPGVTVPEGSGVTVADREKLAVEKDSEESKSAGESATSSGKSSGGSSGSSATSSGGKLESGSSGSTSSGESGSSATSSGGSTSSGSSGSSATQSGGSTSSGDSGSSGSKPSGGSTSSGTPSETDKTSSTSESHATSSGGSSESGSSGSTSSSSSGSSITSFGGSTSSGNGFEPEKLSEGAVTASRQSPETPTTSSTPVEGSGTSSESPSSGPEGSGEWIETGSKGHIEKGNKVTVTSSGGKNEPDSGSTSSGDKSGGKPSTGDKTGPKNPEITTDGEDSESTSSGDKSGGKSGGKPTSEDKKNPGITTDGEDSSSTSSGDKSGDKKNPKNPEITTVGEDSTSTSSGDKNGPSGKPGVEGSGAGPTDLPGEGILTTSSGGKNSTLEHGTRLEKVTVAPKDKENPGIGLEISAKPKDSEEEGKSNEVGLEISWESTTEAPTTPDSDNVGLEISGRDLLKSTKKPHTIEGSGTGDEEITATTRDVSKSTKKPRVEIDGGDNEETSGVDGKPKSTTPSPTTSSEPTPDAGSGEPGVPEESGSTNAPGVSPTSSAPAPEVPTSSKPDVDGSGESTTTEPKKIEEVSTPEVSGETTTVEGSGEVTSSETPKPSEATKAPESESTTPSAPESTKTTSESSKPSESTTSSAPEVTNAPESTTTSEPLILTAGSSKAPESTKASEATSAPESSTSSKTSESTVAPPTEPATVIPPQNREEKPEPTKDTFALPTTTGKPIANETTVENTKCTSSDECGMDALCERRTGVCRCEPGFEGAPPKKACVDVDECATGDHKCHDSARCQNFIGGYACFCPTGFRKTDDGSCEDINECKEHNSTCCGANAQCVNKPGTYSCECGHGFLGDGYHCVPNTKKPCDTEQSTKGHCSESNMSCEVDTEDGSVECKECMSGYKKTGTICEDVNECDSSPCAPDATCINLNGTFSCSCKQGFRGDGFMCTDINECDERHPCHPHAECTNLEGSFKCQCHSGFEGDGIKKCTNPLERSCEDVEKFCGRVDHVSCLSVRIYNGSLSSVCECEPGFRFDKTSNSCVDIDECEENRHNCDPASAACVNTEGSFNCECAEGYEGEGGVCTDIDECDRGMAGCDSMAMCINRMGSCGCKCMAGYTGDGAHCTKIEEPTTKTACTEEWSRLCELEKKQCTVDEEEVPQCGACLPGHHPINGTCQSLQISGLCAQKNDCNKHAECIDIHPDSHFCSCPDGFIGDGMICDDVDECNNAGMCDDDNSKCENTIGSFKCVCLEGFKKLDDKCVVDEKKTPNREKIEEDKKTTVESTTSQGTVSTTSSESPVTSSSKSPESPETTTSSVKSSEPPKPESSTSSESSKPSTTTVKSTLSSESPVTSSESPVTEKTTEAPKGTSESPVKSSRAPEVTTSSETSSSVSPEVSSESPVKTVTSSKAPEATTLSSEAPVKSTQAREEVTSSAAPVTSSGASSESPKPSVTSTLAPEATTSSVPTTVKSTMSSKSSVTSSSVSEATTSSEAPPTTPKPSEAPVTSSESPKVSSKSSEAPTQAPEATTSSEASGTSSVSITVKSTTSSESTTVPSTSSEPPKPSESPVTSSLAPEATTSQSTVSVTSSEVPVTSPEAPSVPSTSPKSPESSVSPSKVPESATSSEAPGTSPEPVTVLSTSPKSPEVTSSESPKLLSKSPEPSEAPVTSSSAPEVPTTSESPVTSSVPTTVKSTTSSESPTVSSRSPEVPVTSSEPTTSSDPLTTPSVDEGLATSSTNPLEESTTSSEAPPTSTEDSLTVSVRIHELTTSPDDSESTTSSEPSVTPFKQGRTPLTTPSSVSSTSSTPESELSSKSSESTMSSTPEATTTSEDLILTAAPSKAPESTTAASEAPTSPTTVPSKPKTSSEAPVTSSEVSSESPVKSSPTPEVTTSSEAPVTSSESPSKATQAREEVTSSETPVTSSSVSPDAAKPSGTSSESPVSVTSSVPSSKSPETPISVSSTSSKVPVTSSESPKTSSAAPEATSSSESPVLSTSPTSSEVTSSEKSTSPTSSEVTTSEVSTSTKPSVTSSKSPEVTTSESPVTSSEKSTSPSKSPVSLVTASESSVTSTEKSTPRVRLITGTPDDVTVSVTIPTRGSHRQNVTVPHSEATVPTTPVPPAPVTSSAKPSTTSSGNRGPPSIQPPPELFTSSSPPASNGGYGEEQEEETTTTTTTEAPSICSTVTCHSLATCEPSSGVCICRDGFIGDGTTVCSKKSSADCISLPSLCADNAKCDNSTRSCECDAGYIGDGYVCSPHPQDCVLRDNLCSPEAICQNRRCQCLPGFTGDGVKCVSIHERASNCSQCDTNAHCIGGTTCKCNPGYFGNGLCCVPDPLDCVHFTGICHPNAVCNPDSRQCQCSSGFSGNGVSCFPQKSCRTDKSVCAKNAICLPTGSCICRHGFKGDPFYKCTSLVAKEPANQQDLSDVSSCATPCDASSQLCISGECICKPGFRRNSTLSGSETCADIDECAEKTHNCDRVATCRNTFGSHVCTCPDGHVGDGVTCVPHVNQGKLSVYCEADGMTLVLGNETSDFEGKIFVKGQAENPYCSKSFSSLLNSHKPYVFKVAFQHCDVQLLDNHTMASTVVVQKHAMFLTNKADSYDLRCQYPIGSRAVESHVNVSELATTSTLTDKNSTLAPICRLSVSNDQHSSISSAMVGDTLKLALEVTPTENFGILPRNCFAVNIESGERYTLTDEQGCAIDESLFPQWSIATSSKVQAVFRTFKWPDSSMIRFQCDCNPCVGQCNVPTCISSARFRRHQTTSPVLNDEIRQELVLMSGVESLAVSSIINVHDSMTSEDEDVERHVATTTSSDSSICVKMAPLLIAVVSFVVCSAILLYLCSKKPKTMDLDSEIRF